MEEFEKMDEVETTKESLRLSFFKENCEWNKEKNRQEEQTVYFQDLSTEQLDHLIEVNYVYIYDQDEVIVKKNKSKQKYQGQDMTVYRRVFRRWESLERLRKVDMFKQNYDIQLNKVEIVILSKKYIPYPRVQQIEETIDILDTKVNNILLHRSQRKMYSLIAAGCVVCDFYKSQIESLCRRKQQLIDSEDEIQNNKNKAQKIQQNKDESTSEHISKQDIQKDEECDQGNQFQQQMEEDNLKMIQTKLLNYNRLMKIVDEWIWRIIDWKSKKMKYSDLVRCLLVSIQYEFSSLSQYLYSELREYILRYQDVISYDINNSFLQTIIRNSSSEYIHVTQNSEIITLNCISPFDLNKVEQIQVDTVFFKKDFNLFYSTHKQLREQKQKYQYYNVDRTRTENAFDFDLTDNDYPHVYHLKQMHDKKQVLIGIQSSEHSLIELYIEPNYSSYVDVSQYKRYSSNYLGYIDRNYWGTEFVLYSEGHQPKSSLYNKEINLNNQKDLSYSLLRYFLQTDKCQNENYSLIINYETNIMAEEPRKFTAKAYNYKEKKFVELKSLEPVYNKETETYQLNFYGRAKRASARNFQVQDVNDEDQIFLLHGKNSKNSFSVDFSYPLNLLQAFAFSIVSISKKFLVS